MKQADVTTVTTLIKSMLTENTGRALCDSGGAYGRHWERNQSRDFDSEPSATLEIYKDKEFMPRVSVYHKLTDGTLTLDDLCNTFNAMPVEDWDCEDYYGVSAEGETWLKENGFTLSGRTFNTYNYDTCFSQVLQGAFLTLVDTTVYRSHDDTYLLLQIHGGCDIRGGYTDAKLFKVDTPFQEECLALRDDCGFSVKADDQTPEEYGEYLSLDWSGEWIDREGTPPSDEYFKEFARLARKEKGSPSLEDKPSITIAGDMTSY